MAVESPEQRRVFAFMAAMMLTPSLMLLFGNLWHLVDDPSVVMVGPAQLTTRDYFARQLEDSRIHGGLPPDAPFQPPKSMGPDSHHVRVVIRTHHRQRDLCRSLIFSLNAQAQSSINTTISFHLVPTEPGHLHVLRDIQASVAPYVPEVRVLELSDAFFEKARLLAKPYRCTPHQRAEFLKASDAIAQAKWCDYENHVYYQATDVALEELLSDCSWCTHLIVTNSDNGYNPGFLDHTISSGSDLSAVSFIAVDKHIPVSFKKSFIDLGSVLFSRRALEVTKGFIACLPLDIHPIHPHDADWHFIAKAQAEGLTTSATDKILFYHH